MKEKHGKTTDDTQKLLIRIDNVNSPVAARIPAIARRQIESRSAVRVVISGKAGHTLCFDIQAGTGEEGFRIEDGPGGAVRVIGNDTRGLFYGLGKFLRSSSYSSGAFTPCKWRGTSVPDEPVRGAYFATHFHNFYSDAPLAEVERYLEDIVLWGINVLAVFFDMHHYQGIEDPAARVMIARLKSLLDTAKKIGLSTALVFVANDGYANSPEEMRADYTIGHDGYFKEPCAHYHLELCPNKPGAGELMLKWVEERLEAFAGIAPDYLLLWPYDQGGCTCSRCAPWGLNGFLSIAEPAARLYRRHVPHGKVILSTWYFDHFTNGEWSGLDDIFRKRKPDWVDYILADDYGDKFPDYPLRNGVPGGFPLVSFPEISMYKCSPWGGYGANPLPHHLQNIRDVSGKYLAGGFPYSEGIYEDINKVIIAQSQWQKDSKAMDTLKEYIAFEYSPEVMDDVATAVEILEKNIQHLIKKQDNIYYVPMEMSADADKAWVLLKNADRLLSHHARKSWRWRILYLRGLIDAELAANGFRITERCEEAFEELTGIYHAGKAALVVSPPTSKALSANREHVIAAWPDCRETR